MAEHGPCAGLAGRFWIIRAHNNGDPILEGARAWLVDAGSRHAPVDREHNFFIVRLVGAFAYAFAQVLRRRRLGRFYYFFFAVAEKWLAICIRVNTISKYLFKPPS